MAVGEIFLAASITLLFEKLASGELWNFVRREGIHTALQKWRRMLVEIEAVLADAEEKQITERGIQIWLEDLEDLAYDLDDVLDEIATEALRRKLMHQEPPASTSKVRALIPTCCTSLSPSTLLSDFRMKSKLDEITPRLQDLFERRRGLGLRKVAAVASARGSQRTETTSLIHEPCVHGRDEDKKAIMELLLSDQVSNTKFGIVPIVGMGGVGKTTLAQMVYNDETVEKHFDLKAWVCVSDNFDIMRVTKAILESVTYRTCDFKELDQVQVQLKKGLAGKKFLIVLDDVWNKKRRCPELLGKFPSKLPLLKTLEIWECLQLVVEWFPSPRMPHGMRNTPIPSIHLPPYLSPMVQFHSLPELMMLNNLEKLEVWRCPALTCLCPGAGLPSTIKKLSIGGCEKLEAVLAEGMTINCPSIESIGISSCDNLKTLPDVIQNHDLRNLNRLFIEDCDNLESLPEGWFPTPNLRELFITGCKKLDAPPQSAYNKNCNLTSLQQLKIDSSPAAAGIASYVLMEVHSLTNLTKLTISNIDKPPSEWCLHRLASLRELRLEDYNWVSFPEDGFSLPTSLIRLRIERFPNLEKLSSKVLQTLTSLGEFCIGACPMVTSIAELGLLTSLSKTVDPSLPQPRIPCMARPASLAFGTVDL
ncbi:hypothetical protein Acr_15g0010310 [Actinidia rufa]|uniref:NB-ARC domain-containing disease resistance protein n=1 Tax=Actinidia rufa TaxID=165716 RepID=A0A7J0FUS2_9ERIC|nr:hypothetical protein Acr_15g0010310 [Actinidia rufa]